MLIAVPPKHSVAQIIVYMKGKSSISMARNVERKVRNFLRHKFWASGYFVSPLKPPLAVPNQTSSFAGGYWLTEADGSWYVRHRVSRQRDDGTPAAWLSVCSARPKL